MKLIELTEQNKDEYNVFVATKESGSFLQSWEWGEWQKNLGREARRFFLIDNITIGLIQLIKMPLPLGRYYLYAPYGPVLDLTHSTSSGQGLKIEDLRFLIQELQKKFPEAIFIRIEPKNLSLIPQPSSLAKTTNIQPGKTLVINLTKSEEQLLSEMHHKTRYNIKLAQKHGVEIKDEFNISVGHGLFFGETLKLILETSKRQKFATFSAVYYEKMVNFFALSNQGEIRLHIYKAIFQNQLLGAAIMVDFGRTRTFLFGGSSEFHKNVMAPYFLHWQAMQDAKNQGLKFYDFWGIETSGGETPGFARFKMGFGGEVITYAGVYDIVQKKALYYIYKILRKANRFIK